MSYSSFYISELGVIKSKTLIYGLIFSKNFFLFVFGMSFITSLIILVFNSINLGYIFNFAIKAMILSLFTFILLFIVFKDHFKNELNSFINNENNFIYI